MSGTTDSRAEEALDFNPAVCDLCGSAEFETLLDIPGTSMTSDSRIVPSGLRKIECARCKLVRNGHPFSVAQLEEHYGESYELGEQAALAEPLFFTEDGPVPRSRIIFDWMAENLAACGMPDPRSVCEVGCGEGNLLAHFARRWPGCEVTGVDMSERSLRWASEKGLKVRPGSYRDVEGQHDLIFSFAVIEHVPSPRDFLTRLGSRLTPGGLLLTAQPCQDQGGAASYDIFFSDHLHHFFSGHVTALGRRAGLGEIRKVTRHPHIPDISLHVFAPDEGGARPRAEERGAAAAESQDLRRTVARWLAVFDRVNRWLDENRERGVAVWGVGQTFTFLRAYTNLRTHPVEVAFEDNPDRLSGTDFGFPVVPFESWRARADARPAVLFTFVPSAGILERLGARGLAYSSPLAPAD